MRITSYGQVDHTAPCIITVFKDTIIDSVKYNYVTYYKNGRIHELGSVLTRRKLFTKDFKAIYYGHWIVFDSTSIVIEKGLYKKNKKTGFWKERLDGDCCWTGE